MTLNAQGRDIVVLHYESVFLLSASEAGLSKVNKMYVPEQLQSWFFRT